MKLKEIIQLKPQGILNLDNVILTEGYTEEEITSLINFFSEKQGIESVIINLHIREELEGQDSYETILLKNLVALNSVYDICLKTNKICIVRGIGKIYNNPFVKTIKESNPNFLIWYMAYQLQFNPIMYLNKSGKGFHFGPFTISDEPDIIKAYLNGVNMIKQTLELPLIYNPNKEQNDENNTE